MQSDSQSHHRHPKILISKLNSRIQKPVDPNQTSLICFHKEEMNISSDFTNLLPENPNLINHRNQQKTSKT
jgi:hypothetical protein